MGTQWSREIRRRSAGACLLLAGAMLCGCARERVSVTLGPNGTWTRKAVYVVTNLDAGPQPADGKAAEVADSFKLPSGDGWKLTNEKTKDEKRVIAVRTVPLDETIENDIVVKETPKSALPGAAPNEPQPAPKLVRRDDPPKPPRELTGNSVTVRQVSPGRYIYTETIHWKGEMPTSMNKLADKEAALARKLLPGPLATDENVAFVADTFTREFDLALVGPPSPLIHRLPLLMSAPEVFVRLVSRRLGNGLLASLKEKFGDRMTAEQRTALATRLVEGITDEMKSSGPSQADDAAGGAGNKNGSGSNIFIAVKLPGRVIQTNGAADPFSGEISWSFYPEAAAFGDLVLTATCDANARTTAR